MKALARGFTLIELMIVVAIIGILASVALPVYQDYTKRAKISEVVLAASGCRTRITEVYQTGSSLPAPNLWGCGEGSTTKYVASIATDGEGKITILASAAFNDAAIDGLVVTLVPLKAPGVAAAAVGDPIYGWRCGDSAIDGTTILAKFLPSSCRG